MTELWNPDIPVRTNGILADVDDIEENLQYLARRNGYFIDPTEVDQGATGNSRTVKYYVDTIGTTKKATLFFPHHADDGNTTTYTLSTSETIPSNITLEFQNGALIADDANNADLTINGPIIAAPGQHIFDYFNGSGTVKGNPLIKEVYPEWWGVDGTDWQPAIQAAVDFCQQSTTSTVKTLVLFQTYLIDTPITLGDTGADRLPFRITGMHGQNEGTQGEIKASGSWSGTSMIAFDDNVANSYFQFDNFKINGNDQAGVTNGMYTASINNSSWENVTWQNCIGTGAALKIDAGWLNTFRNCKWISNKNGVEMITASANNNTSFYGCNFSSNTGVGLNVYVGTNILVSGTAFQSNAVAAIIFDTVKGFSICDNYFETNGNTGISVTSPSAFTLNTAILFNSNTGTYTVLDNDAGGEVKGGMVKNNRFSHAGANEAVIYANAVASVDISNNFTDQSEDFIAYYGQNDASLFRDVRIRDNIEEDGDEIVFSITATQADNQKQPQFWHTVDMGYAPVNYFNQNFLSYTSQKAGAGGSIGRSDNKSNGLTSFEIDQDGGQSHAYGLSFTLSDYGDLAVGDYVWFGAWINCTGDANLDIALFVGFTGATDLGYDITSAQSESEIVFRSVGFKIPTGATAIQLGFSKFGTSNNPGTVGYPIFTKFGTHYKSFGEQPAIIYRAAAAPTVGHWNQGDQVWNTGAAAGGSPGWVCTTAGEPGTWKAMANVAA